jgi:hypothetical protein
MHPAAPASAVHPTAHAAAVPAASPSASASGKHWGRNCERGRERTCERSSDQAAKDFVAHRKSPLLNPCDVHRGISTARKPKSSDNFK